MKLPLAILTSAIALTAVSGSAQQPTQPELKVDSSNRTLTVSATDSVSVEPDQAILHIGFVTQPQDAKGAYAEGTRASNAIISALKQAGGLSQKLGVLAEAGANLEFIFARRSPLTDYEFSNVQAATMSEELSA